MTYLIHVVYCGVDFGTVQSEEEGRQVVARHIDAALSEGLCPVHHEHLQVEPPGVCLSCRKVWHRSPIGVGWTRVEVT